jgi:hypothetical protein
MEELPSTERGPRQSDNASQTGTGAPRSADEAHPREVAVGGGIASHPADADETAINRSGSGGSGGAATEDDPRTEGSAPQSMDELLGGGSEKSPG